MYKITGALIGFAAILSIPIFLHGENTEDYYYEEKSFDQEHHIPTTNLPNPNTEQGQLELWKDSQDSRDDLRDIYPDPKARMKKYNQQNNTSQNNTNNNQRNEGNPNPQRNEGYPN